MPNIPFADAIHAFLEDEANVEALTDAVQELSNICINGTSDRLPVGIQPLDGLKFGGFIPLNGDLLSEP